MERKAKRDAWTWSDLNRHLPWIMRIGLCYHYTTRPKLIFIKMVYESALVTKVLVSGALVAH